MFVTDTIAAVATPMSSSGIGIIRISGDEAIPIVDQVFITPSRKKIRDCVSHTIHYGHIQLEGKKIDEVMVVLMKGPKSYTREDTVEINCHGGIIVLNRVLEAVLEKGARLADPGEFTKRAFLNGRIDLSQAESVIDLINAKNEFARTSSFDQLQGVVSNFVKEIRSQILHEIAFIESALDDPEHISLDGYEKELLEKVINLKSKLHNILINADSGAILKEGIHTVIVGKPNAGKSSLLNALLKKERAIVTDIAGTTRDAIEEQVRLNGISLNMIDTAGIRETEDVVEKIGVEKSKEYVEKADLIIYVVDSSNELSKEDFEIMELIKEKKVIVLLNKSDLNQVTGKSIMEEYLNHPILFVSAKDKTGILEIEEEITAMFFQGKIMGNDEVFITSKRHQSLLKEAYESLNQVESSLINQMPEDFYSIDLMNGYESLGKIIGEAVEEDLVNEIFSKFCMGK